MNTQTRSKIIDHDKEFVKACEKANEVLANRPGYRKVEPTKRQFSKWLRGYGSAYDFGRV